MKFAVKVTFDRHMKAEEAESPFRCDQLPCSDIFEAEKGLRIHLTRAHNLEKSEVAEKIKEMKQKDSLKERDVSFESQSGGDNTATAAAAAAFEKKSRWNCKECEMSFINRTHMDRHMSAHKADSCFKCEFCSDLFEFEHGFKLHLIRTHKATREEANDMIDHMK